MVNFLKNRTSGPLLKKPGDGDVLNMYPMWPWSVRIVSSLKLTRWFLLPRVPSLKQVNLKMAPCPLKMWVNLQFTALLSTSLGWSVIGVAMILVRVMGPRTLLKFQFFQKQRCAVEKKRHGHNFQNLCSKSNQRGRNPYSSTLIRCRASILKIVAVSFFCNGS